MSNLDQAISLLEDEAIKISTAIQRSGVNQTARTYQLEGIRRAINVLNNECLKEIKEKIRKKGIGKKKIKIEEPLF